MYTVYKVTNIKNNKYYIGVHKTNKPNDSYLGSGKAIKDAIKKYGRENFVKEVLFIFDSEHEAYDKEKELTEDYDKRYTYNMKRGGVGGFNKEDAWKGFIAKCEKGGHASVEKGYGFGGLYKDASAAGRKGGKALKGKPKSESHKEALRESWRRKKASVV